MSILIPILAVTFIGIICGIGLSVASHVMRVKVDDRFVSVRGCLPGANCGACGYSGCDGYANAILSEGAPPYLCVPGGAESAKALSEIMGVEAVVTEKKYAVVRCNGSCGATGVKYDYDGIRTCAAVRQFYSGAGQCAFGCLGYGDCANVCPNSAITLEQGVARVNRESCVGCGLCEKVCPQSIIDIRPAKAKPVVLCSNKDRGAVTRKICTNGCIGCKKCEKACAFGAIRVENDLARIDPEKCTGCGECVKACPVGCISVLE